MRTVLKSAVLSPRAAQRPPAARHHLARQPLDRRFLGQRQARERRGRLAELVACVCLILKGYRIIDRRLKAPANGPAGEIDLIAVRGRRLAFVEVKQRRDHEAALAAIAPAQVGRMEIAVEQWLWRHPRYRNHHVGLDAVVLDRHLVPRHLTGALHAW